MNTFFINYISGWFLLSLETKCRKFRLLGVGYFSLKNIVKTLNLILNYSDSLCDMLAEKLHSHLFSFALCNMCFISSNMSLPMQGYQF